MVYIAGHDRGRAVKDLVGTRRTPVGPLPLALLAVLGACAQTPPRSTLGAPELTITLPNKLREISGIAQHGANLLGIQDEVGTLFEFDLGGVVVRRYPFGPKADYEDLAWAGDSLFVLRSDGLLLELQLSTQGDKGHAAVRSQHQIGTAPHEYESLAYDERGARLLFAPKITGRGVSAQQQERPVMAFDLRTRAVLPQPLFVLTLDAVQARAGELGVALPRRTTAKGKPRLDLSLRISALALQPNTDRLWVLSAAEGLLLVTTLAGTIEAVHVLPTEHLRQAEGLCFASAERLWVASEGKDERAVLCAFRIGPPK